MHYQTGARGFVIHHYAGKVSRNAPGDNKGFSLPKKRDNWFS